MTLLHPRLTKLTRYWLRRQEALKRQQPGAAFSYRPRAAQPLWMDYFPWAPGTIAEKMVFSALVSAGITFFFGPYWGDMPFTEDNYERYRPDFILPDYRIVIEVYGTYWHTRPESYEKDATRASLYEASGYRYYMLWDTEIFANPPAVLDLIPELRNPSVRTGMVFVSERPFDPTAALRGWRRKNPKVVRERRATRRALGQLRRELAPLRPPKLVEEKQEPAFLGFDEEYKEEMRVYGEQWRQYIVGLGEYFQRWPGAAHKYQKEYNFWLRWQDWWDRWQAAVMDTGSWAAYIDSLGRYFGQYPEARRFYAAEYYRWLAWRRMGYRRL